MLCCTVRSAVLQVSSSSFLYSCWKSVDDSLYVLQNQITDLYVPTAMRKLYLLQSVCVRVPNEGSIILQWRCIYQADCSSMFSHVCFHVRELCVFEWVGVWVCFHVQSVYECVCRHVGAIPCLRRNPDTGKAVVNISSHRPFLSSRRATEGLREGASERGLESWEEKSEGGPRTPIKV